VRYGGFCWLRVSRVVLYLVQVFCVCDGDLCSSVFEGRVFVRLS